MYVLRIDPLFLPVAIQHIKRRAEMFPYIQSYYRAIQSLQTGVRRRQLTACRLWGVGTDLYPAPLSWSHGDPTEAGGRKGHLRFGWARMVLVVPSVFTVPVSREFGKHYL